MKQAGLKGYKYIDWFREHPVEDDLKLLKWSDKNLGDAGYVNWYKFDHPQLGAIELGGWDLLHTWTNPPGVFLENEIKSFPDWLVWQALISPKLEIREASATSLDTGTYRIKLVVENSGWLPTYVTKKALEKKLRGVVCEIVLPKGAKLESGKSREVLGQLEGRVYKDAMVNTTMEGTRERLKVEWIIRATKGGKVKLNARHERAGRVTAEIDLR